MNESTAVKTIFDEMFKRRLLFLTGKGGVGKSTVASLIALIAKKRGKRPLIVEIDTKSAIRRIFDVNFVGFIPFEVADKIWAINIDPAEALLEYIEQWVKIHRVAKAISRNAILKYFFRTAPAVNEFVTINKIRNLMNEKDAMTGDLRYDPVIVDLPATGHAMSFLDIPNAMKRIAKVGPIRDVATKYEKLFYDEKTTLLNYVTLPEEMPVTEMLELIEEVRQKTKIPMGAVFINQSLEHPFTEEEKVTLQRLRNEENENAPELADALQLGLGYVEKIEKGRALIERLGERMPLGLIRLPRLLTGQMNLDALYSIIDALDCD